MLAAVLRRDYRWTAAQVQDLLRTLRKATPPEGA
jgi:hypothetical protein